MNEKTFAHQSSLPSLPLPTLEETLSKYLISLSPIIDNELMEKLVHLAESFSASSDGKYLQNFLEKKQESTRNWLEEWWYEAYTTNRNTLLTQNMGAIISKKFDSIKNGCQLSIAAQFIHNLMNYWKLIRREEIGVTKSRGSNWDMSQVYNLFNSSRVPKLAQDEIQRFFKTEAEGNAPTHIIVICNGHIWKLETMNNESVKDINDFFKNLSFIRQQSVKLDKNSIVPLTALQRDEWANIRKSITENDEKNSEMFSIIDSAVFVLSLANDIVENESELMKYSLFGSPFNSFCDKNLNIIILRDGKTCLQAEHGNVDAISLFSPCDFAAEKTIGKRFEIKETCDKGVQKIEFQTTLTLSKMISEAEKLFKNMASRVNVNVIRYDKYGSTYCKSVKMYADTIIQIAIQMAFVKTHNKLAPTYETASTRKFFHGRTETVRSLTPQIAKYLEALENGATIETTRTLFFEAYNAHNVLMELAREGKGIDRHFLGLRNAQRALKSFGFEFSIPILDDCSFNSSGGGGNFLLSTSLLGYNENGCFGYVTPMCADGYGVFYKINSASFTFTISNFKDDASCFQEFSENLEYSLDFIKNIFLENK